eukprot:14235381-Ditylum_brightwellii.AAC.1
MWEDDDEAIQFSDEDDGRDKVSLEEEEHMEDIGISVSKEWDEAVSTFNEISSQPFASNASNDVKEGGTNNNNNNNNAE